MLFTDIRLQNYRSYSDSSFELGEGVNIVVGPNAAGKTNLLEALMVSATGKSYRVRDNALIKAGSPWARIDVHTSDNTQRTAKIQLDQASQTQKVFEIDTKTYKRLPLHERQPIVLFEPDTLQLLSSEPTGRREYFDDLIEQYTIGYGQLRAKYRRTLAQRNALLKQGRSPETQLFAWNLRLSELAGQLVAERIDLAQSINQDLSEIYSKIAKHDKKVQIHYENNIDTKNYSTNLLKKLESSIELDLARGFTGSGPHRDDFVVYFGEQPAVRSASRGEIRTLILALKIIEMQILEKQKEVRPLLLLDDVFSELDVARRRALTSFLKNHQTIITTTDADVVIKHFTKNCTIIPVG